MTTFEQFQEICRHGQGGYIRQQKDLMSQAEEHFRAYREAMGQLGLHEMSFIQIDDRKRELARMEREVDDQFVDGPTMRWSYQRYLKREDQPVPHHRKAIERVQVRKNRHSDAHAVYRDGKYLATYSTKEAADIRADLERQK